MENLTNVENAEENGGAKVALCPLCRRPVIPIGRMAEKPKRPDKLACRRCRRTFWRAECPKVDSTVPRAMPR